MEHDAMTDILKKFGIYNQKDFISQAFSRNIGLLTLEEQDLLSQARVAIPGMGGVGGVHLITLVRSGIGKFNIADFDVFEPANVNRQFGARVPDFGRPKLEVMKEQALFINPYLELTLFETGINESNLDKFLDGVDVVIDGLDFFQFEIRRALFKRAAEKGIWAVTAGPMGFSSAMLVFDPKGMGFDEYFNISDKMEDKEKYLSFALGLAPRPTHIKYMNLKKVSLDKKAGPSSSAACHLCAGMAATETLKIILKRGSVRSVPYYSQFDAYLNKYRRGRLPWGNKNPVQWIKKKAVNYLLEKNKTSSIENPLIPPEPVLRNGMIERPVLEYLIRAGMQAPSGDNCQPWRFDGKENRIDLYCDQETDLSFFNVNQIASLISCGAVMENIRIAASQFGLDVSFEYSTIVIKETPAATIYLHPAEIETDPLADQIWQRHTNRKMYKSVPVSTEMLERIKISISNMPEVHLNFITDKTQMRKVARIIYQADRIRTEFRPLHEHLMKMIRFSEQEAIEKRDGFPLKNLEAGIAGETFLRLTKPWHAMNFANKIGLGRMVALHSYQGIMKSSGVGLLSITGTTDKSFVKGGQALERMWLTLHSLGLKMQPMTAVTLFNMRLKLGNKEEFLEKHLKRMEELQAEFGECFPETQCNSKGQVMLFRFGYADDIECRTLKKILK